MAGKKAKGKRKDGGRPVRDRAVAQNRKLPTIRQQLSANDPPWMVHESAADGNCLFHSLRDQLLALGDKFTTKLPSHVELRRQIVGFIDRNGAFYSLFMEDDEEIGAYVERMREDETWGGHVEMLAIARALRRNVEVFEVRPGGEVEKIVVEGVGSGGEGEEGKGGSSFPLRVAFMKESYTLGEHYDAVVSL